MAYDLIIDPGHGGKDGGGGTNALWKEKDLVLKISKYQFERFKELGLNVAMTRDNDVYLSPEQRTNIVKNSGARYCLSNHINAGGGDGAEFIHSIYADGKLENRMADEIKKEGQNVRRVFTRALPGNSKLDYYFMHRDTGNVSTTIAEYGFADSKLDDVEQLESNWKTYAEAIVRAYCAYLDKDYTAPVAPKTSKQLDYIGHRFEKSIKKAMKKGAIIGYPDGNFRPDDPVTRGQLAVILDRLNELD